MNCIVHGVAKSRTRLNNVHFDLARFGLKKRCEQVWAGTLYCAVLVAQLCLTLCDPVDYSPPGSSVHEDSPGKNTGVGCHALLQGIFPTPGLNPGLPHCRQILYWLSHQGSPKILKWVAYPFSKGSSQLRNWTGIPCIAVGFFTSWATRESLGP